MAKISILVTHDSQGQRLKLALARCFLYWSFPKGTHSDIVVGSQGVVVDLGTSDEMIVFLALVLFFFFK